MSEKQKKVFVIVVICAVLCLFVGVSFAWLQIDLFGTKENKVIAGDLVMTLDDTAVDGITLANSVPMLDEVGKTKKSYTFSLENRGTLESDYLILLEDLPLENEGDRILDSKVKYQLIREKDSVEKVDLLSNTGKSPRRILMAGTLLPGESSRFTFRLWIDKEASNEIMGKSFHGRIKIDATQTRGRVLAKEYLFDPNYLGAKCNTYDDGVDTFLVGECSNNYIWYSGKLWRAVAKNNATGDIRIMTQNAVTNLNYLAPYEQGYEDSYVDQWLTEEFLPTLRNAQHFLVTDAIYDVTPDEREVPTRPVGQNTVTRTVGLLNYYEFYTILQQSLKLTSSSKYYLDNGHSFWLSTQEDFPREGVLSIASYWHVFSPGEVSLWLPSSASPLRPTVYLKGDVYLEAGLGTENEPHHLRGDQDEYTPGTTLVNTRFSGEYVSFNNELYRIVGVENGLTKITSVYSADSSDLFITSFDKTDTCKSGIENPEKGCKFLLNEATIYPLLENYYQNLPVKWKNLVQPNMTWYLGWADGDRSYKLTACKEAVKGISLQDCEKTEETAISTIGLPRMGEMFTAPLVKQSFRNWTLTPYRLNSREKGRVLYIYDGLNAGALYIDGSARVSLYLKETVSIDSGDGTKASPYQIS